MVSFPPNSGFVTPLPYIPPAPSLHVVGGASSYGYTPAYSPGNYQTYQQYYPQYPSTPAYNQIPFQSPAQSPTIPVMPTQMPMPNGNGMALPMTPQGIPVMPNGDVGQEIGKLTEQHAIGGFQGFLRGMVIALVPAAIAGGFALWHGLKRGIATSSLIGQVALITGICLGLGGSAGATLAFRREFQNTLKAKGGNPLHLFDPRFQQPPMNGIMPQ